MLRWNRTLRWLVVHLTGCLAGHGLAASSQLAGVALPLTQLAVPEAKASTGGRVFVTSDDDGYSSEEFEELRTLVIWCVIWCVFTS